MADVMTHVILAIGSLAPLDPGSWMILGAFHDGDQSLRVKDVRFSANFVSSRIGRLARRIPGAAWFLRPRDDRRRAQAIGQTRIDHVSVGNVHCDPDKCTDLPIVARGGEIRVRVTNAGDRPIMVRVLVEGVAS